MNEKPRRRWLQFSIRGLFTAVLLLSIGLAVFTRWWFTPLIHRQFHPNGRLAMEYWQQRDWRGELYSVRWVEYYSTGTKAGEEDAARNNWFWSPDGKPATLETWLEHRSADQGDGTFGKLPEKPE